MAALNKMAFWIGKIGRRIPHVSTLCHAGVVCGADPNVPRLVVRCSFRPTTNNFFFRISAMETSLAGAFNRHFYWFFITVGREV